MLKTRATRILIHPVANRDRVTEVTPSCIVSGFDSIMLSPTGIKSQAHWQFMANRAGRAREGAILPDRIRSPVTVEKIWAATAPAPRMALRPGMEQRMPIRKMPGRLPPMGFMNSARNTVRPEPRQIPIKRAAKPMKGSSMSRQVLTASRADW